MTSEYNEKLNKLNTALENVYLKKENLINELNDLLDNMITGPSIMVNITSFIMEYHDVSGGVSVTDTVTDIVLGSYKTYEAYYCLTENSESKYGNQFTIENDTLSFLMPQELSFENAVLFVLHRYQAGGMGGEDVVNLYLYELDSSNDTITISTNELPRSPPSEG